MSEKKTTRPALSVGQVWRTRKGEEVALGEDLLDYPFVGSNGITYTSSGFVWNDEIPDPRDLIELISDAPATRPALKVGQVWRTRGGSQCTIKDTSICLDFPVQSDLYGGHYHHADGSSCLRVEGFDCQDDLIELISDAPTTSDPTTTPNPVPAGRALVGVVPRLFAAPIRRTCLPNWMVLDAIADDGTAWYMVVCTDPATEAPAAYWRQIPPLPQPEAE
jgi:hypothetical protein